MVAKVQDELSLCSGKDKAHEHSKPKGRTSFQGKFRKPLKTKQSAEPRVHSAVKRRRDAELPESLNHELGSVDIHPAHSRRRLKNSWGCEIGRQTVLPPPRFPYQHTSDLTLAMIFWSETHLQ